MHNSLKTFFNKPDAAGKRRMKFWLFSLIIVYILVIGYACLLNGKPLYRYEYNLFLTTNVPEQLSDVFFRFYPDKFMYRPETGLMVLMPMAESEDTATVEIFQERFYTSDKKFSTEIFSLLPMPPPKKIIVTFLDSNSKQHKLETELDLSSYFHGTLGLIIFENNGEFSLKQYITRNPFKFLDLNDKDVAVIVKELEEPCL